MEQRKNNQEKPPERNSKSALLEAVDEALREFGESGREALYLHLARAYAVKKEDIAEKFDVFLLALRRELGSGSKAVEALVLDKLYEKEGQDSEEFQLAAATMILASQFNYHGSVEHAGN